MIPDEVKRRNSDLSIVTKALAITNFSPAIQGILSEAFDEDGDGHISTSELVVAATNHISTRKNNAMLRKGLCIAVGMVVFMIGVNAGLTAGIIKANKDTQVEGRSLMTKADEPVSIGTNEVVATLATLPFLPVETVSHVIDLTFSSGDGETVYHRKTKSIDVQTDRGMKLKTTDGDTLEWSVDDGTELMITLEDGTAWNMDVLCTECTATNVYSTPDVLEGLERFESITGTQRHRRLQRNDKSRCLGDYQPSTAPSSL